eukprot:1161192-Pelagomonas_calceolata.AAC.4
MQAARVCLSFNVTVPPLAACSSRNFASMHHENPPLPSALPDTIAATFHARGVTAWNVIAGQAHQEPVSAATGAEHVAVSDA